MRSPTTLRPSVGAAVANYVSLKQALGRRFAGEAQILAEVNRFVAAKFPACPALTAESFASWCLTFSHLSANTRRLRMRVVRNLCLYMRRTDPACFVPDPATFPAPHTPRRPHIFSMEEIVRILRTATALLATPRFPLRNKTYRLSIVLLYTLGLRRGELVRLTLSDYDPVERTLLVRASKFHKSRLVALSGDAAREMDAYLLERRRLPHDAGSPLLVTSWRGLRARSGAGMGQSLRQIFRAAGVYTASGRLPRVHDLRHTHAVHALLRWYQSGQDVQAKLPALATSMGHASVVSTAYYLAFLEPLAQAASGRFATHCAALLEHLPVNGGN